MSAERWRTIPGFSRYAISDRGRVKVFPLFSILKPDRSQSGHLRVRLLDDGGKRHMRWVHRLVLETFLGSPVVRHLDDDKTNNRLENLAWGSRLDNAKDAKKNGVAAHGVTIGTSKLNRSRVAWIRRNKRKGIPYAELARRIGMSRAAVSAAGRGDTWSHVTDPPPVREGDA